MATKATKNNGGLIDPEKLKSTGPYPPQNRKVMLYSIGASNEGHGDALPSNIDDYMARRTAAQVSEQTGFNYRGHIPYSSDRVGEIARDWNPGYIPMSELITNTIRFIQQDVKTVERHLTEVSHVAIISGHGGNNFLKDAEADISKKIGKPFFYMPPFPGIHVDSKVHGRIDIAHADHGEHSVALYLGMVDLEKLANINRVAAKDPLEALRQNPPIMGLGYYILPQLGGPRYEPLRAHQDLMDMALRFINKDRKIIADPEVGREFFEKNIAAAKQGIEGFIRKG
jgi:creatinine amidohydrolase/Fe(II)-dependent formamide hydrolase-like protein